MDLPYSAAVPAFLGFTVHCALRSDSVLHENLNAEGRRERHFMSKRVAAGWKASKTRSENGARVNSTTFF